ncbi:MAG: MaoC family dehydratase [Bdellovibrionaceae bacterium]|nr:MaoC family dehydratase [Pseudobdellovibrionaceae bacterium]
MFKVGDKILLSVEITDDMVRKFAEVSGDFNPMHMDDEYAAKTRFKKRIAHGMLSAALISRALGQHLGPGGIYLSQNLKFMSPVYIGDTVSVELTVSSYREERGIGAIETLVKNQNGELCVKGEAMIMTADRV